MEFCFRDVLSVDTEKLSYVQNGMSTAYFKKTFDDKSLTLSEDLKIFRAESSDFLNSLVSLSKHTLLDYVSFHSSRFVSAYKSLPVHVRWANPDKKIPVYRANGDFDFYLPENNRDFVITSCDEDGHFLLDKFGHSDTRLITAKSLMSRYTAYVDDLITLSSGMIVYPKKNHDVFIKLDRDLVIFKPWGKNRSFVPQCLSCGSYLNITNTKDIYGVSESAFSILYTTVRQSPDSEILDWVYQNVCKQYLFDKVNASKTYLDNKILFDGISCFWVPSAFSIPD